MKEETSAPQARLALIHLHSPLQFLVQKKE
jgi:hypothetical protein